MSTLKFPHALNIFVVFSLVTVPLLYWLIPIEGDSFIVISKMIMVLGGLGFLRVFFGNFDLFPLANTIEIISIKNIYTVSCVLIELTSMLSFLLLLSFYGIYFILHLGEQSPKPIPLEAQFCLISLVVAFVFSFYKKTGFFIKKSVKVNT